jgi:hypothetical protein
MEVFTYWVKYNLILNIYFYKVVWFITSRTFEHKTFYDRLFDGAYVKSFLFGKEPRSRLISKD